jgi:anti-sigma B factor antagonist
MPQNLEIQRERQDGFALVAPSGEVDLATARGLGDVLRDETQDGVGHVVVDLSEVTYLDSTGLGVLLSALRRLTRLGRSLALVCPEGSVRRVFEITDLIGMLGVHETREEALAELLAR